MEWFHFSDFHIGKPHGPQAEALASLIEAVEQASAEESGKIDAVFFTGDIAYSGKQEEYDNFKKDFLIPLRDIPAFANAILFAVPGNHDVDCDASLPIVWDGIGKRNQDIFFCENENGQKARSGRASVFNAYWEFVSANDIISPNPSREVSILHHLDKYPFDVFATNTAFFSDREKTAGAETAPSPITSLRFVSGTLTPSKPCIVLAHHPIKCLFRDHQRPFQVFLKDKKGVLFHGHEHELSVTFNPDGTLRNMGFGASYLVPLQDQSTSPYQNTFAHCSLGSMLRVRSYSWQPTAGRWLDTTAVQLSDCIDGNKTGTEPVCFYFPQLTRTLESLGFQVPVSAVRRSAPSPTRIIPVGELGEGITRRLFLISRNLSALFQKGEPKFNVSTPGDGKLRIEIELPNGQRDLAVFIPGLNHILSSKEVESINTELDTEGFASATVISLGDISSDAERMYLRLKTRKPLEVLTNKGLTQEADRVLSDEQRQSISRLDAAKHSVCLMLSERDVYILVVDEEGSSRCFYVIPSNGNRLPVTDPIITALRKGTPDFSLMTYAGEKTSTEESADRRFCENEYLTACYNEYNVMKYAALASVGIRFSEMPLDELYVNASASEVDNEVEHRAQQLIDDHLATYPLSDELRSHIQKQLLASVHQGGKHESSQAREFCQKYGAVLITGDPGSGKTCFLKSEILAYCRRSLPSPKKTPETTTDWHSRHIPVMVSLSEVVSEQDLDSKGLFPIISRILERRGLLLPSDEMNRLSLDGRLAFFFDGVDEVVSVEKRSLVVKLINELVTERLTVGNRVVVTSRPAAVQVVNILPSLHRLELQGLTESEMRTLAERLLNLNLSGNQDGIHLSQGTMRQDQHILISQLVADCAKNAGISRMAKNPLLLTLLIIIYANSGAPSAKRHLIYEEAIKTLASVRSHEAGHRRVSLQDLRERLGAVALSVYRKESGLLPSRSEVRSIVRATMMRQHHDDVTAIEADAFIQLVAESTGLIVIEPRKGESDDKAVVAFMHHSFLEYFAAIGLSKDLETIDVGSLVTEPRWHEILTLLAGIIGENEDVAPIIARFMSPHSSERDFDARALLFAIDCALECDIPSEAAQRLLRDNIYASLSTGSARLDPWVRSEIGLRLRLLLNVCGSSDYDMMLAKLVGSTDEAVSAAALDLIGYACEEGYSSQDILRAVEGACARSEESILSAICQAVARAEPLRTETALQVIPRCLNKSGRCRRAAFEALSVLPSMASEYWGDIINGIDDKNSRTSRWASIAAIQAGLNADLISLSAQRKDVLLRALNQIDRTDSSRDYHRPKVKKATLSRLLAAPYIHDRVLGIRLLPLADADERYIYEQLLELIRGDVSREGRVAALFALRWSHNVLSLVTVDDIRAVANLLVVDSTMDVKVSAIELLGSFGGTLPAIDALLGQNFAALSIDEYCASVLSLGRARIRKDNVSSFFSEELESCLASTKKMNEDNVRRITVLFDASRRLRETFPSKLVKKIRNLVDDFRVDERVRRKSLLCFPAVAMPSQWTVENVQQLFIRPPVGMDAELVQIPATLAWKCRESVDYVFACVKALSILRVSLLEYHAKLLKRRAGEENEFCVSELRNGIDEVTQIIIAFQDFIGVDRDK